MTIDPDKNVAEAQQLHRDTEERRIRNVGALGSIAQAQRLATVAAESAMKTDRDIAALCVGIYDYPGETPVQWDHYDDGKDSDQICWGAVVSGGVVYITMRGSVTFEDWRRDFNAFASPFGCSDIGPVHPGFLLGMEKVLREIKERFPGMPYVFCGHSLGAGRASILAGLAITGGCKVAGRVVFGEPRPGFRTLQGILSVVPHSCSYRNGSETRHEHDPVTDVPFVFGIEQYVHPTPLIDLYVVPPPNDPWDIFAFHHMTLYYQGVSNIGIS